MTDLFSGHGLQVLHEEPAVKRDETKLPRSLARAIDRLGKDRGRKTPETAQIRCLQMVGRYVDLMAAVQELAQADNAPGCQVRLTMAEADAAAEARSWTLWVWMRSDAERKEPDAEKESRTRKKESRTRKNESRTRKKESRTRKNESRLRKNESRTRKNENRTRKTKNGWPAIEGCELKEENRDLKPVAMPMDDDNPAAGRLLESLLAECVRQDASDLHLAPDLPPYFRMEGLLEPPPGRRPLSSAADTDAIADLLSADTDRQPLEAQGSLDGALTGRDGTRYRFNVFRRQGRLVVCHPAAGRPLPHPGRPGLLGKPLPAVRSARRAGGGGRADRGRQEHHAGHAPGPHQPDPALPHDHDRRPHRIPTQAQARRWSTSGRWVPTLPASTRRWWPPCGKTPT